MKLRFIPTQSNPGAVGFSPQRVVQQKAYLAFEKHFLKFLVISFMLNVLNVHHDTLRHLGMFDRCHLKIEDMARRVMHGS